MLMKKTFRTFAEFVLFLAVFAFGSFLHPFNLHWATTSVAPGSSRYFIPDGLLLAMGVFLAIIIVQAMRKRMCDTTWTIVAFLLAVAIGYALQFGFITQSF
jgi:xanthine/uracil permease